MREAIASLFKKKKKIYHMKLINYLLIVSVFVSSCKEDTEPAPSFAKDYGTGMYIITDNGVSFFNYKDTLALVQNGIYRAANNLTINNPKKIKFSGNRAYIIGNNSITTTDVNTFEDLGIINGFNNPVDIDFISEDRLFVADNGDSKIKVVDLQRMEITSDIETGDSTSPAFIVSNSYKSFVLNAGGSSIQTKDSTVIVIDYRDDLVAIADFSGCLSVGHNPNSAVIIPSGVLKVLCKGVYDPLNSINNTESSLSNINQYSNQVYSTDNLSGIYNAQDLISNWNNSYCYFTAEGGVYMLNTSGLNPSLIVGVNASVIYTVIESLAINDSTLVSYEMLYMDDTDSPNSIYKYNLDLSVFVDTIIVNGIIKDINFY